MIKAAMGLASGLALFTSASAQAFAGGNVRELLEMLIRGHELKVDSSVEKGCGKVIPERKGDPLSLGELVAFLTEKLGYGEGKAALRPECDVKSKEKVACTLWFATGAGTPEYWRAGVHFEYDPTHSPKQVTAGSVSCISGG